MCDLETELVVAVKFQLSSIWKQSQKHTQMIPHDLLTIQMVKLYFYADGLNICSLVTSIIIMIVVLCNQTYVWPSCYMMFGVTLEWNIYFIMMQIMLCVIVFLLKKT